MDQNQGQQPESVRTLLAGLEKLSKYTLFQYKEAIETLGIYTRNLIDYPDDKKFKKVKLGNIHFRERLGSLTGAIEAMNAIGYTEQGEYLRLVESERGTDRHAELIELKRILTEHHEQVSKEFESLPVRHSADHTYSSVQGCGEYHAQGRREHMEDDDIVVDQFCGIENQGYFGLYDGHGGRGSVDFVVKTLHNNLEYILKENPNITIAEAYEQSYITTDAQLRRQSMLRSGTTSVSCLIRVLEDGSKMLYHANVGDSRAILCRDGKAQRLTIDHKPTLDSELARIKSLGGSVTSKRVFGVLAISRALGDHMLKENDVVTASPFCGEVKLAPTDQFLILACDGVWDVMEDQDAVDFVLEVWNGREQQAAKQGQELVLNSTLQDISRGLVQKALQQDSTDNVSVMCIKL